VRSLSSQCPAAVARLERAWSGSEGASPSGRAQERCNSLVDVSARCEPSGGTLPRSGRPYRRAMSSRPLATRSGAECRGAERRGKGDVRCCARGQSLCARGRQNRRLCHDDWNRYQTSRGERHRRRHTAHPCACAVVVGAGVLAAGMVVAVVAGEGASPIWLVAIRLHVMHARHRVRSAGLDAQLQRDSRHRSGEPESYEGRDAASPGRCHGSNVTRAMVFARLVVGRVRMEFTTGERYHFAGIGSNDKVASGSAIRHEGAGPSNDLRPQSVMMSAGRCPLARATGVSLLLRPNYAPPSASPSAVGARRRVGPGVGTGDGGDRRRAVGGGRQGAACGVAHRVASTSGMRAGPPRRLRALPVPDDRCQRAGGAADLARRR